MPVCRACGRFGKVLTIDFCPHCGANDWVQESLHDKTMREHGESHPEMTPLQRQSAAEREPEAGCGCLTAGLVGSTIAVLGGLWLLIAIIKWMWQHS